MTISGRSGRAVGLLLLAHLVAGLILPYVLLLPVSARAGAFLESAAAMELTLRLCVLMLVLGAAASLGISVLLWSVARQHHHRLGLWLLALAAVNFTLQLVENAHWLSLLTISQAYGAAGADRALFETLGIAAHASFRWAHYSHILIAVGWLFTLYLLLHRAFLVPRWIAAAGMGAALLHFIGITLPAFGGYRMPYPDLFGAPLGVVILVLVLRLMARGFPVASIQAGGGPAAPVDRAEGP